LSKRELEAASEVLTRDGYLLKCAYSVHYRVADAEEYYFQVDDPAALVLAQAEASLRAAFIHRPSDELLISKRTEVQDEVRDHMQAALTELECGVSVTAILLGEVHASSDPGVHYAFRDVASSLEDKQRYVRQAEEYRVRRQAAARANAAILEESAQAQAHASLQLAEGDAQAFLALRAALAQNPEANHLRLQLETLEKLLGGKRLVLVLDPGRVVVPIPADGSQTAPLFGGRAAGSEREGDR
jgi:modulator of FtsH protease HflK